MKDIRVCVDLRWNCQYKYLDAPCRDCMSHDSLVAEVERLKQENEKLKEALRKHYPYIDNDYMDFAVCIHCGNSEGKGHKENCEYIKLCGEGGDEKNTGE